MGFCQRHGLILFLLCVNQALDQIGSNAPKITERLKVCAVLLTEVFSPRCDYCADSPLDFCAIGIHFQRGERIDQTRGKSLLSDAKV